MVKPSKFVIDLSAYKITPQDVWSENAPDDLLKLDWNESPIDFDIYQKELIRIVGERGIAAWYPDYLAIELTNKLSSYLGIDENFILTFPGSDVGLETLCRAYLEPEDIVIILTPTYENFFVYVLQTGATISKLEIKHPFNIDVSIIEERIRSLKSVKAVYMARPNNPCGYMVELDIISVLSKKFPDIMFIVDEAYIEFSDTDSCVRLVESFPNIVVARTFSKAFGLAGLRLGYLCASLEVVNTVNKIRNGKNISMIAQRLGVFALNNKKRVNNWVTTVKEGRTRFEDWCRMKDIEYYPSHGNFVLFKVKQPNEVCSELKAQGVYVRNRTSIIPGFIRVTIGSRDHVSKLISSLNQISNLL